MNPAGTSVNLIDTHAHLYYDSYQEDFEEMLERAENAGVQKIICIGVDLTTSESCLKIAEKHSHIFATAGVHPHEASKPPRGYVKELENFSTHPKIVAIGEIGLDYHYDFSPRDVQIRVFRDQLELAKSLELPTVVHNRESDDDLLTAIQASGSDNGVVHCFGGSIDFAAALLETGYHLSFTGTVTFKRDLEQNRELLKSIPLEKIMVETDSPYLSPVPLRGKRNEPGNVRYVAEQIADWKGMSLEEFAHITTETAHGFFKKIKT